MLPSDPLSPESLTFWIRVGAAVLCGGVIGIERQSRGKVAGVRTSILITLGTTMFVTLAASLQTEGSDPTRVLGQVVTGIGFLGAGVILAREGRILGVTTASVIWVLAGLGPDNRDLGDSGRSRERRVRLGTTPGTPGVAGAGRDRGRVE
jgi:uncharacterized membrane protein YhiD involved in acid resistance